MGVPAEKREVELTIERLAAGGRGVGRVDGVVWFVAGGLPGDRVVAAPVRAHRRFVEGRVARRLAASPDRRTPPCPLEDRCGGCPWMALDEGVQRRWKRRLVSDALGRIAGSDIEVAPVLAPSPALGYRNKVELTLGRDSGGRPVVGMHGRDGGLVDVPRCAVQAETANAVLATARDFLLARAHRWVAPEDDRADPFRLVVRWSRGTGAVLVAIRETARPFPDAHALGARLAEAHPEVVGVVRIRARPGQRGGSRVVPVHGKTWIEERIGETTFRLPAASFLQVNTEAAETLLELVREGVGAVDGRHVADLYGGAGVFGIDLARRGARVVVCEADVDAVRCGRRAARASTGASIRFVHGDVGAFLREAQGPVDVVVANPPRAGLGRRVPRLLQRLAPGRIVIVSCDAATLARDVGRLVGAGFALERAVPVDLFPQTAHVETVVTLSRVRTR